MPELTDPDNDGILEFTQTVEDVDGDSLSITGELDQINGTTQTGSDRNPSWFSFTTSSTLSGGTRIVDVNVQIDASELGGAGTTYTFELYADDGVSSSTCTFTLSVESSTTGAEFFFINDNNDDKLEKFNVSDGSEEQNFYSYSGSDNAFWPLKSKFIHVVSNGDVLEVDPQDGSVVTLFTRSFIDNSSINSVVIGGDRLLVTNSSNGDTSAAYKLDGTVLFEGTNVFGGDDVRDMVFDKGSKAQFVTSERDSSPTARLFDSNTTLQDSVSGPSFGAIWGMAAGEGVYFHYEKPDSNSDPGDLIKYDISGGSLNELKRISQPGQLVSNENHHVRTAFFNVAQQRLVVTVGRNNEGVQVYDSDLNGIWGDDFLSSYPLQFYQCNGPGVHMLDDGRVIAFDSNYNCVIYEKDGTRKQTLSTNRIDGVFLQGT